MFHGQLDRVRYHGLEDSSCRIAVTQSVEHNIRLQLSLFAHGHSSEDASERMLSSGGSGGISLRRPWKERR